jgi:hypothetical protein
MTHHELAEYDAHPEWGLLLCAYARSIANLKAEWSPRLTSAAGLPIEQLSVVHGRLIALGFLRFEIASGAEGVQYQLTPLGRQAILPPEQRSLAPEWLQAEENLDQAASAA